MQSPMDMYPQQYGSPNGYAQQYPQQYMPQRWEYSERIPNNNDPSFTSAAEFIHSVD